MYRLFYSFRRASSFRVKDSKKTLWPSDHITLWNVGKYSHSDKEDLNLQGDFIYAETLPISFFLFSELDLYCVRLCYIYIYIYIYILLIIEHTLMCVASGFRLVDMIIVTIIVCSGPGSSVGIATDYGLDGPGSNPGGDEIVHSPRPALGPTQSPVKWVPGLSRG